MKDTDGHLDTKSVVRRMGAACPMLQAILDKDADLIQDLPYLEVSWIAKALVTEADESCVRSVMRIAEEVLRDFGQEGRDFIGAGLIEGIPDSAEGRLRDFAGPLTIQLMDPG